MLRELIRHAASLGRNGHAAAAVNAGRPGSVTAVSSVAATDAGHTEQEDERRELTDEELERQVGEPLPERTQMSVISIHGHTLPVEPPAPE